MRSPTDRNHLIVSERLENAAWNDYEELQAFIGNLERSGWEVPFGRSRPPTDGETRVVVADIHGAFQDLYRLLLGVGAINEDGTRNDGFWICQIGDLISGYPDTVTGDLVTLSLSAGWVDCQIVGNHDLPFMPGEIDSDFAGMSDPSTHTTRLLDQATAAGRMLAAFEVDGWTLTHGGIDPRILRDLNIPYDPKTVACQINRIFEGRVTGVELSHPLTDWIGLRRGGRDVTGSVFWCDWGEMMKGYHKVPEAQMTLKQIVGHTGRRTGPRLKMGCCWHIDMEREVGIACLVKQAGEWEPRILHRTDPPGWLHTITVR